MIAYGMWRLDTLINTLKQIEDARSVLPLVPMATLSQLLGVGTCTRDRAFLGCQYKHSSATHSTGHTKRVNSVVFSPDGNTIASGSSDNTVRLWDAKTGTLKDILTGHTLGFNSVAFSPDGNTLASGSWDKTVRLWDAKTGALKNTITGHTGTVNSVAFSPDGNTLAAGSRVRIRLWDTKTGTLKNELIGHTARVSSVAFSPDGNTLASGNDDGTVLLWDLAPAEPEPESLAADVNNDGSVNIQDLVAVAAAFGETGESLQRCQ